MNSTTLRRSLVAGALVLVLLAGTWGVRRWCHLRRESAEQGTALRNHLERIVILSRALEALDDGRPEDARAVLAGQFVRSFDRADTILGMGNVPYDPQRRYRVQLERAREYARRSGASAETLAQADRLIAALPTP